MPLNNIDISVFLNVIQTHVYILHLTTLFNNFISAVRGFYPLPVINHAKNNSLSSYINERHHVNYQ